jgi:hypothetical protein
MLASAIKIEISSFFHEYFAMLALYPIMDFLIKIRSFEVHSPGLAFSKYYDG